MPAEKSNNGKRISISPSPEIRAYLEELAEIGIRGKTPTEVAMSLVSTGVEQLIKDGFLTLRNKRSKTRQSRIN